jgi:myo-inositol-1(or 4)-monophosphatase
VTVSLDMLLETAVEGARRAGRVLADRFHEPRTISFKGGIDLVTDADKASEAVLLAWLASAIRSTPSSRRRAVPSEGSRYRWIIDPLDGTTNYAHQLHTSRSASPSRGRAGCRSAWCTTRCGDELFSAVRGRGDAERQADSARAASNGWTVRSSAPDFPTTCASTPRDRRAHRAVPRLVQGIRRLGSAALDLAYTASGRYDGYFEFNLKPWDVAAGR